MKGVSVVICCYNSANRISKTLEFLAKQRLAAVKFEIILVNNNSTDQTSTIALGKWDSLNSSIPFKIVDQPKPGLNFAREKGFSEAQYDYILMVDDDNWLSENYVQEVYNTMSSNESIGVLGGYGIPEYEVSPPPLLKKYELCYAVGPHASKSGDITETRGDVYGAGATIRKRAWLLLKELGFESIMSDRQGANLSSGGDNELCIAIKALGYNIWYNEDLKFYHFIPKERLTEGYLIKLQKGIAMSFCKLRPYYYAADSQFRNRAWYKKNWLYIIIPRLITSTFNGDLMYILAHNLTGKLNERTLGAYSRLAYLKTVWKEKNMDLSNYKKIVSSRWFNFTASLH